MSTPSNTPVPETRTGGENRRKSVVDRRSGLDRRIQNREDSGYTGPERRVAVADRRSDTGLERRRGPEEGEMTGRQFEFVMAIEAYKKVNKRLYPSWTEVLEVIEQLGYRKVAHRSINLPNVPEPDLSPDSTTEAA
jgi:hypothetical protein